tara:strand:- start:129 stop:719 length:591 start_codon:yes stop_codon:yes gene_type:complete
MKYKLIPNHNDYCKAIIFRIPKVANSSFKILFPHFATKNKGKDLLETKKILGEKYDSYFKFAFVRNPWDRVVSCWADKSNPNHAMFWPKSIFNIANGKSFDEFVNFLKNNAFKKDRHIVPQVFFVPPDIDFIGRFENLQEDFNTVCDKIGIPQQQLPHENKSNHKHYTEYYDDETREIVGEKYARDIEYFGYKFGE